MTKLGRLKLKNPFILAPMAGYSDEYLRKICYDYGASYSFTELIHTAGFIRKPESLMKKFDFHEPLGLQFISNKPEELKEAIRIVNEKEFYPGLDHVKSIDLNLGCPAQLEMRDNLGAALLDKPEKIRELFAVMRKYSDLPVSTKIRTAISAKHGKTKPYLKIAKIAEEENLDFITIHGRTAVQQYSGEVDVAAIKEVARKIDIPIIGNGNIIDEDSAEKMLEFCDAVMIGRFALTSPFIFKQLDYYFKKNEKGKKKLKIDIKKEKIKCIKKYIELAEKHKIVFPSIKMHIQSFLRGIPGQKPLIVKLTYTKNINELKKEIKSVYNLSASAKSLS